MYSVENAVSKALAMVLASFSYIVMFHSNLGEIRAGESWRPL